METKLENNTIEIGQESLKHLNSIRKWAMFLAIMGFILLGLVVLIGLIAGTFLTAFSSDVANPGIPTYLIYIIIFAMAAVYFFPVLFMFRFSKYTAHAVQKLDKQELNKAFKFLKYYFTYIGILIIIVLSIYLVALIVAGSSISFLKGLG
jgi:hypothetical protein